jgi:hypothetical protein
MVHHQVHGRINEGADGRWRKSEADEVDGGELALLLVGVAGLELSGDGEVLPTWIQTVGPPSVPPVSIPRKRSLGMVLIRI